MSSDIDDYVAGFHGALQQGLNARFMAANAVRQMQNGAEFFRPRHDPSVLRPYPHEIIVQRNDLALETCFDHLLQFGDSGFDQREPFLQMGGLPAHRATFPVTAAAE
ncbi:MAG: hypothetical protein LCH57_00395 [Proteobacteria bacterium]|nr:hypothetical protein [Pseudomonadota bacterium]